MKRIALRALIASLMLTVILSGGVLMASEPKTPEPTELMYGKFSPQPLTVKLSADTVHTGESVWLTVSGGVEPYILIAVENKIQVNSRGKNTYQITGLTAGDSGLTIGDSKNNTITKVITVLPKR